MRIQIRLYMIAILIRRRSREEAYSKFIVVLILRGNKAQEHTIHPSFIPLAYLPCTILMTLLRRVVIKNLQLETHHRGTYLLLQSITPPSRITAIMAVIEDGNSRRNNAATMLARKMRILVRNSLGPAI
jgi:hypothetical protein